MDREAALHRAREPFAAGDPLRGIAALAVAAGHVIGIALLSWLIDRREGGAIVGLDAYGAAGDAVGSLGTAGVSVFFVLSGYLLSRPFVRAAVLDDRRPSLVRFARNRVLRVVPAYWAVLTVLVLTVVLTGVEEAGAGDLLTLYAFAGGQERPIALWVGHGWTLDVEMQFYVVLGLGGGILALARGRAPALAVGALAVALAGWSFAAHSTWGFNVVDLGANAGRFSAGIALAALEVSRHAPRRAHRSTAALFAAGVAALAAISVAQEDPGNPLRNLGFPLLTLAAGAVVAAPLVWQWGGGRPWRALDNAVLRWAGTRSYPIYLVHVPVYAGLCQLVPGAGYRERSLLLLLVGVPLALLAAEALHRFVEVPFLRRRAPSQAAPDAPRDPAPV